MCIVNALFVICGGCSKTSTVPVPTEIPDKNTWCPEAELTNYDFGKCTTGVWTHKRHVHLPQVYCSFCSGAGAADPRSEKLPGCEPLSEADFAFQTPAYGMKQAEAMVAWLAGVHHDEAEKAEAGRKARAQMRYYEQQQKYYQQLLLQEQQLVEQQQQDQQRQQTQQQTHGQQGQPQQQPEQEQQSQKSLASKIVERTLPHSRLSYDFDKLAAVVLAAIQPVTEAAADPAEAAIAMASHEVKVASLATVTAVTSVAFKAAMCRHAGHAAAPGLEREMDAVQKRHMDSHLALARAALQGNPSRADLAREVEALAREGKVVAGLAQALERRAAVVGVWLGGKEIFNLSEAV